jgi:hypothetical protein
MLPHLILLADLEAGKHGYPTNPAFRPRSLLRTVLASAAVTLAAYVILHQV